MIKRLLSFFLICFYSLSRGQCPQIYSQPSGTLSASPLFINCTGNVYNLNFQSNSSWGTYTINWGDLGSNTAGASYVANSIITHTYAAVIYTPTINNSNTFTITLTIPSQNCTLTGLVVQESSVSAAIQIPSIGITQACAPKSFTFTNNSANPSSTSSYTWNFGDGTAPVIASATTAGQNINHLYNKGTVNCETQITLQASNYCSFGNPTTFTYTPIKVFDVDSAKITVNKQVSCLPDVTFTFSNTTTRNCVPEGNTFQRKEQWNFGNYWGFGHDSIIGWNSWPPSSPRTIAYPNVAGTYSVLLRDSNLCGVSIKTIAINILSQPTASLIGPAGPFCQNAPITFTNVSALGYTYLWNFGAGAAFVNLGPGNKANTYTTPGTYTVRMVAQVPGVGGSCSDTANVIINVLAAPVASFSINNSAGCGSLTNVAFTNLSTGALSWNWNFANGNTSTLQVPPTQSYTFTGTFTPTLTITGASGCFNVFTNTLIVRPKPVAAFAQFTSCVNSLVTFTNTSFPTTGINAITNYTWSFGDFSPNSNGVSPNHLYTAAGSFTVKLKAQNAFCTDSISQAISVIVKPSASFLVFPAIGCPPLVATFTNNSINGPVYNWDFGVNPAATSSLTNPTFTFYNSTPSTVVYTVTLVSSTGGICGDTTKKTITVFPQPTSAFTTNTLAGCSPLAINFTNTSAAGTTTLWIFGDGGATVTPNASHIYTNTTVSTLTFVAQLAMTNTLGCADTAKKTITVYPTTLPNFTMLPPGGCSPLSVNFQNIPGIATYSWNHGDGSPTFTTSAAHTWTFVNNGNSNTTVTVSLNALTTNGCLGSQSQTIEILSKPIASYNFSALTTTCSPLSITFINSSLSHTASNWTFGNGQTSTASNPSTTFTNVAGGGAITYSVKLVVTNANSCTDSLIKTVNLFPQPKAAFQLDTHACVQKVITFTNNSIGGSSFFWTFGDGSISTLSATTHQFINTTLAIKVFKIRLLITDLNNCQDSVTIPLNLYPKPNYVISSSPESGCSPLKVLFRQIPGVTKYEWSNDGVTFGTTGDISSTFVNPDNASKTIKIKLIARDANQCVDTAEKNILVHAKPIAKFSAQSLTVYLPSESARFSNLSSGATIFSWTFGDGGTSKEKDPVYTYFKAGEYPVMLIASNQNNCRDTFQLPEKIIAIDESNIVGPNAFTPNTSGSPGTLFDPKDMSNDIFHPNAKNTEKYVLSIYSRWGELLFETKNPGEGWDGYYRGKLCTQDVYVWKISATFIDGGTYNKTGNLLLLR